LNYVQERFASKNAVFLGESGSGKTEVSVNWARALAKSGAAVTFIDMDQTKGLFRARDLAPKLTEAGVNLVDVFVFQDAPLAPQGVSGALKDESSVCVFDVGGNAVGARMMGQFAEMLREQDTRYFYIINPLRPFSGSIEDIRESMEKIFAVGGVDQRLVSIISNPCMGTRTTTELILEKHEWLEDALDELCLDISFMTVDENVYEEVAGKVDCRVFPISVYVKALYER
jgi:nitrogenase subunit NifH